MTIYLTDQPFVEIQDKNNNQLMKLVTGFVLFRMNREFHLESLTEFPILTFIW